MGSATSSLESHTYSNEQGTLKQHQIPIVYDPAYNVRFYGLQRLHYFDSCKYEKILAALMEAGAMNEAHAQYISPGGEATQEELSDVHTEAYLESLKDPMRVAEICELPPIGYLPSSTVDSHMLTPMRTGN